MQRIQPAPHCSGSSGGTLRPWDRAHSRGVLGLLGGAALAALAVLDPVAAAAGVAGPGWSPAPAPDGPVLVPLLRLVPSVPTFTPRQRTPAREPVSRSHLIAAT